MPTLPVAGIADEIDAARRRFDHERGPQRHAAVGQITRRPTTRRSERDGYALIDRDPIVPIVRFGRHRRIMIAHDGVVAQRRDDQRAMGRASRDSVTTSR